MDKIQLNIPSPALVRLKALSRRWDKSVSEIIRMALERLLAQVPGEILQPDPDHPAFEAFELGKVRAPAEAMRELLSPGRGSSHGTSGRKS